MANLPPITDLTGAANEGAIKTYFTSVRSFLAGVIGTDGTLSAVFKSVSTTLTAGMLGASHNLANLNVATTLSIANGNIQHGTMTGSFTLTSPNDADDGYLEVELTIDAIGGYTLTLSGFNEISGTADMTANVVNVLRISKLNTNTYLEIIQAV